MLPLFLSACVRSKWHLADKISHRMPVLKDQVLRGYCQTVARCSCLKMILADFQLTR